VHRVRRQRLLPVHWRHRLLLELLQRHPHRVRLVRGLLPLLRELPPEPHLLLQHRHVRHRPPCRHRHRRRVAPDDS
jgi:hypothetical protein